jgi:sec-independent protein translocase protein TatB
MFEVGFTEIILILGLALLVLGPEKLPGLAEKIGRWTGRARSMARQLKSQLEQEVTIEQMAKSKPMQPQRETPADNTAQASAAPEPAPAEGFDLDKHFEDGIDTTPEAMHGRPQDYSEDGIDTTPEAMHGKPQDRVET